MSPETTERTAVEKGAEGFSSRGAEELNDASSHGTTARAEARGSSVKAPPPKRRVLLVDDEEKILASLRRLFRRQDYELVTANCGPEALKLLEADPVQLIISDYRMPGMNGVELLHKVRQRWPDTLRIILSGYSEASTIIAAINEGEIYKFISKPWNDEEIKLHVRRALEQHELEDENRRMASEIAERNERLRDLNAQLEQRASDASTGLTSTQNLLETIGVGVLTVDDGGLIVGANRHANEFITSAGSELIGIPIQVALPKGLSELISASRSPADGAISGRLELDDRMIQYRVNSLMIEGVCRGMVIALWEEVK